MSFAASHLNLFYILLCQDTLFMLRAVPLTSLGIITLDKYTRTTTCQRRDLVARVSRLPYFPLCVSVVVAIFFLYIPFLPPFALFKPCAIEELSFVVN